MTRGVERRRTAPLPAPTRRLTPPEARALALLIVAVAAGVALVLVSTALFIQMVG
jgi:4-hydroxybenzoate polyprenyltransferase